MTQKKTNQSGGDDRVTSRGTVKGPNVRPEDERVPEGGPPPAPTTGKGEPKQAASRAEAEDNPRDGTSAATVGKREQEQAAAAGAAKTQSGRGHRKD